MTKKVSALVSWRHLWATMIGTWDLQFASFAPDFMGGFQLSQVSFRQPAACLCIGMRTVWSIIMIGVTEPRRIATTVRGEWGWRYQRVVDRQSTRFWQCFEICYTRLYDWNRGLVDGVGFFFIYGLKSSYIYMEQADSRRWSQPTSYRYVGPTRQHRVWFPWSICRSFGMYVYFSKLLAWTHNTLRQICFARRGALAFNY